MTIAGLIMNNNPGMIKINRGMNFIYLLLPQNDLTEGDPSLSEDLPSSFWFCFIAYIYLYC